MAYDKPLPMPNLDTKPFWDGCKEHELRFQKCRDCGLVRWPPSIICPGCYSTDTEWIVASGRGKVYTFGIFHEVYHPAFKDEVPYVTASVELEEGPRLLTNVVGCSTEEVRCDIPVGVVWDDVTEEFTLPKFKPVS
jgi:uncharacterized OB-fold protein